ncbi:MAG: hypothetical protein RL477_423 [Pseudomonadota bacterium]|jgi:hypothetical protein
MAEENRKFRVISGGQTGVDRAALDAARAAGLAIGGWCPKGRRAEDGEIDGIYPLRETASADPDERTAANIAEADATLIIVADPDPAGWGPGTRLTHRIAIAGAKPYFVICLREGGRDGRREGGREGGREHEPGRDEEIPLASARAFIAAMRPRVLNIAGPRESGAPGIYARTRAFLARLFAAL